MKKSELKEIIKECIGDINEWRGDERHIKQIVDDVMDELDDIYLELESNVSDVLTGHDMKFLEKLPIAKTMFKGINHKKVHTEIDKMIRKELGTTK